MKAFRQHAGGGLSYQTPQDKRREYILSYLAAVATGLCFAWLLVAAIPQQQEHCTVEAVLKRPISISHSWKTIRAVTDMDEVTGGEPDFEDSEFRALAQEEVESRECV